MTEAAQSLIKRALQSDSQSVAHLLIDSAARIDPDVDKEKIKRQWLDGWMMKEYNKISNVTNKG